jgi:hypothetical protein
MSYHEPVVTWGEVKAIQGGLTRVPFALHVISHPD